MRYAYVYAYKVPSLNAIKVGRGTNPESRMADYSKQYGFTPDPRSLKKWKVPIKSIAEDVENALHTFLIRDLKLMRVETGNSRELFQLGSMQYVDVLSKIEPHIVIEIERILSKAEEDLKKTKSKIKNTHTHKTASSKIEQHDRATQVVSIPKEKLPTRAPITSEDITDEIKQDWTNNDIDKDAWKAYGLFFLLCLVGFGIMFIWTSDVLLSVITAPVLAALIAAFLN